MLENKADNTSRLMAMLSKLVDQGLTFADCVRAFGVQSSEDAYAREARRIYHEEGAVEIDDTTVLSMGDTGCYVMAWVWVGLCSIKPRQEEA